MVYMRVRACVFMFKWLFWKRSDEAINVYENCRAIQFNWHHHRRHRRRKTMAESLRRLIIIKCVPFELCMFTKWQFSGGSVRRSSYIFVFVCAVRRSPSKTLFPFRRLDKLILLLPERVHTKRLVQSLHEMIICKWRERERWRANGWRVR